MHALNYLNRGVAWAAELETRALLWAYTLLVTALALAAYPTLVRDYGPYGIHELREGLVLLFAAPIAELLVVHVHFRKNAHSFSLLELPLTAGLMICSPLVVVVSYSLGGAAVLLLHRRQPPLKLTFNTSQFVLTATLAVWVYCVFPHPVSVVSPASWLAALLAAFASSAVGSLIVFGIVSLAERRAVIRNLRTAVALGLATAAGGASLGIACAILVGVAPAAVLFVTAPLAAVFLANRAYEAERQRRENLQVVYDTSRTLTEEPESERALFGALLRSYESLPVDFAAIILPLGQQGMLCLRVDDAGEHRSIVSSEPLRPLFERATSLGKAWRVTARLREAANDEEAGEELEWLAPLAGGRAVREAMFAPLLSGAESVGVAAVGSTGDTMRHLGENEIALFETVCRGIASHTRLTRQANQDALTNLPNRRRLMERLVGAYEDDSRNELAILLIDLDDFKTINDTFGHGVGDTVLIEVANRLVVAAEGWMVARLGGDEFALAGPAAGEGWAVAAEAIIDAFRKPVTTASEVFTVRVSIGAALGSEADAPATLLRNADTALYEAKRLGKGQVRAFNDEMHRVVARRYAVAEALRTAIERDETTIVIQPVVCLDDGSVVGGEALSRWTDPVLGSVAPDEFIHLAEESGLSVALSRRVMSKVVEALQAMPGALHMSFNVSPGDLEDRSLVELLLQSAKLVHPHSLTIEVTERMLVSDPTVFATLTTLRAGGVGVSIDDFGTGYSSLAYLKNMPSDSLKIPREFVRELDSGSRSLGVVDAIMGVGRALAMEVIAEGVESRAQQSLLLGLGVTRAQGYLFSPPLGLDEFIERVREAGYSAAA